MLTNITSKIKAIRTKYHQTVDSGKKNGHGRVVLCYFELCQKICGGSPATDQIVGGLETWIGNEIAKLFAVEK